MRATPSFFSLLTAAALLMTGCGGPAEPTRADQAVSPLPSSTASREDTVPLITSCMSLFGSNSLAKESLDFLIAVESIDPQTAKTASSFASQFEEVAKTAKPELAKPLQVMQAVFEDFVQASEDSGNWSLGESYAAAKDEIVEICSPELTAAEATESGSSPTAIAPSLTSFESEFLAAGISTGYGNPSIEEYIKRPVQTLCNPDITDTSQHFRDVVRIWTGGGFPEDEAKSVGKGKTFTRLVVKYHCPDRLDGLTAIIGSAN